MSWPSDWVLAYLGDLSSVGMSQVSKLDRISELLSPEQANPKPRRKLCNLGSAQGNGNFGIEGVFLYSSSTRKMKFVLEIRLLVRLRLDSADVGLISKGCTSMREQSIHRVPLGIHRTAFIASSAVASDKA